MKRDKPITNGYRLRMEAAFALWEKVHGRTQAEFAAGVGQVAGRSFTANSALGWIQGAVPRDLEAMVGLAAFIGVPPGWLFFGEPGLTPIIEAITTMREALDVAAAGGPRVLQLRMEGDAAAKYFEALPAEVSDLPDDHIAVSAEVREAATKRAGRRAG